MTTASTGPHQFSMEGWISPAPFEKLLNMTIVEAAEGRATLTMPFLVQYAQGAGLMHGGALVSLADTSVVMAIKSLLPPGSHFATIRLETKFLHPVKKGVVTAKAALLSRVDRIIEGQATLYDEENRAVMEFASTFKIARDTVIEGITYPDGSAVPGEQKYTKPE
ncbi:MAG: acyl-CoA thioesterase [Geobacteraceae bacterium GWC2_58_44]|nr:MAG: acyl-CoA thioesterase [Geobacteraceae bacterium GWC2_58_44]HBG08325.1 PaaI family thioesterase [Geobacter sp.]